MNHLHDTTRDAKDSRDERVTRTYSVDFVILAMFILYLVACHLGWV